MSKKSASASRTFSEACEYLSLPPDELAALRERGLVACSYQDGKQVYPQDALDISQHLIALQRERGWTYPTLAWYADLVFATEVGRAILLPIQDEQSTAPAQLQASWLETQYASAVLHDLKGDVERADGPLVNLLRCLTAIGENQQVSDGDWLEQSSLLPIIQHFEATNIPVLHEGQSVARDMASTFGLMMYAFTVIAPPISAELRTLAQTTNSRLRVAPDDQADVPSSEKALIAKESKVAVDKFYASKVPEIHRSQVWEVTPGLLSAQQKTIRLEITLPIESEQEVIDNIIDLVKPVIKPYGARVIHLLYEIANDPPYWRTPLIALDSNDILDRLGLKRDSRGIHYSRNRERLRDVLDMAHRLEIVGEYITHVQGQPVRKAIRSTLISLIGAEYDVEESRAISTGELFQRGLPKTMTIRLNFYSGIRRPDGRLGNQYVLTNRLKKPEMLGSARHSGTEEMLRTYLMLRYRQARMASREIRLTRKDALEKAGITTGNVTRATQILERALNKLVEEGTVERYDKVPIKPSETFSVLIGTQAALPEGDSG